MFYIIGGIFLFTLATLGLYVKKHETHMKLILEYLKLRLRMILSYHLEIGYIYHKDGKYHLVYHDGSRKFKMVFLKDKRKIIYALCNEENVTSDIMEYMGPGNNFYGIATTPKLLGYDNLTITYKNGTDIYEKQYSSDEVISLN